MTLTKEKIKEVAEKAVAENGQDFNLDHDEQIERLINYLTQNLDLELAYYLREGGGDYWTQTEYYSKKLHKTIIWDYDTGSFDGFNEIADWIIRTENEIKEFEESLPQLKGI